MSLVFSIPGKTFLAGEYLALHGGPSLVFLSEPRFEMSATKGEHQIAGLHAESPAGLFIKDHQDYFEQFQLSFKDPYQGKGGFGASTAQFLSVYALWLLKENHHQDMEKVFDFKHLLENYYTYAWNGQGLRPSGADLVGQLKGALTFFEKRQGLISVKSWPFASLEFVLVHTGNKLATHEHLRSLGNFSEQGLESAFLKIKKSFDDVSEELFIEGILDYRKALADLSFTCQPTLDLLNKIDQIPGVVAAKGCGALGADVVLVVLKKGAQAAIQKFCDDQHLSLSSSSEKISAGLQVRGAL